jgi:hypothetical protein
MDESTIDHQDCAKGSTIDSLKQSQIAVTVNAAVGDGLIRVGNCVGNW